MVILLERWKVMVYKTYEYDSFRIFAIETDQFKNCHMEVIFQSDATHDDLAAKSFLAEMMSYTSKQYPTRKEFVTHLEELYSAYFYGVTTKIGKTLLTNFIFDFLDPFYVKEKSYLDDCMKFLFETLMEPNCDGNAFDFKTFQIIKSRLQSEIESLKENPTNYSLRRSLQELYPKSISSKTVLGSIEELSKITPESLLKTYQDSFQKSYCDIYIIGNLDMDQVAKMILRYFKNRSIKTHKQEVFVKNKKIYTLKKREEEGNFVQSNLVVAYQMQGFGKKDYDYVLSVFGEIFCGSSLNSKLYRYLRNENSLCYRIQTIYQKYDDCLLISVGLDGNNKKLAVKLIQKAMKEMTQGNFSDEELEMAKKQLTFGLTMSLDNQNSILNSYFFHNLVGSPLIEERKEGILTVTKSDVIRLAKKMKMSLIYELKEASHEGN